MFNTLCKLVLFSLDIIFILQNMFFGNMLIATQFESKLLKKNHN